MPFIQKKKKKILIFSIFLIIYPFYSNYFSYVILNHTTCEYNEPSVTEARIKMRERVLDNILEENFT